jgi:hypothetical protein
MAMSTWKYYQHALISATAPHETPDLAELTQLMKDPKVFFARWTTDWDLPYETEWWYCVKDTPFDINELKSKLRYKINYGKRFFTYKMIKNVLDYSDDLFAIQNAAFLTYRESYKPDSDRIKFDTMLKTWCSSTNIDFLICKNQEVGNICGYAVIERIGNCAEVRVVKVNPDYEKIQINAAIACFIVEFYLPEYYISNMERPTRHITKYPEYLMEYFRYRKVYCKLHIKYKLWFECLIYLLFPFSSLFEKLSERSSSKLLYNMVSILKQEKIRRSFL